MIRLVAQYRIKPETESEVLTAIRAFVDAVHEEEASTDYHAYRLADTNQFLHVMAFPNEAAQKAHQEASYTQDFVEVLYPNCEEPPQFTQLELIE